jgi:hypothetical protein
VLFFEAATGGGQVGGINQSNRPRLPSISGDQRREQMLVDPPQPGHAHAAAELVQDPHAGHLGLTTQTGKLSPGALLWQHFDQQVQGMHWREQTQQVHPVKLCRAVIPPPTTGGTSWPAFIDEIVGNKRIQKFKQSDRAGRRKVGVHGLNPTFGNLTRQRQRDSPQF